MKKLLTLIILVAFYILPLNATTYYLATAAGGGSDSNNGTSAGTPWLSPNHAVNCGDVIMAAASTAYSATNFANGKWGTVTCSAGNNVAWLICATFDGCKVSFSGSSNGILISASYWGIQGWESDGSSPTGTAFGTVGAHHVIFANNIGNGGGSGCIDTGGAGVSDYFVIIGNICYNSTTSNAACYSGIDVFGPNPFDSVSGTHIYIAGNFSWDNVNPTPCGGVTATDGEGILFDFMNENAYSSQVVADNNIVFLNGGRGIQTNAYTAGYTYFRNNTAWGDNTQAAQSSGSPCSEALASNSTNTEIYGSILQTNSPTDCGGVSMYPTRIFPGTTTHVYNDWEYDSGGNYNGCLGCSGFSYGPNNITGTSAAFANPVDPGAPNCGSFASVPACMATVIANFTPTTVAAKAYGYQIPLNTSRYDPLYPQWLCTVTNLPAGLVTPGCTTGSGLGSGMSVGNGGTVH
jgi:hypothetical protein